MKTVEIEVPSKYKWMARQPTGEWFFSVRKPFLDDNGDKDGFGELFQWWESPIGPSHQRENIEFDIQCEAGADNWRESLRKI